MSILHGNCDPRFGRVKKQFLANLSDSSSGELGAALAVYVEGQLLVDLWGGYLDLQRNRPWHRDSQCCVFSCTKGVVAIIAMRLVQAGLLDYNEQVVSYWPEYGCFGKERTLVKQLLSHQAGIPTLAATLEPGEIWNWESVTTALAISEPKWEVGARHGYHALTWGYLVGCLLERASGVSLPVLLQREVCDPLHVNFSFGLDKTQVIDAAILVSSLSPEAPIDKKALANARRLDESQLLTAQVASSDSWRAALIPGANGHVSAIDLATIYQALIAPDSNYLEKNIVAQATAAQVSGRDAVLGSSTAYGLGFQLATRDVNPGYSSAAKCWGHKGIYGSTGFVDPEKNIAVGYVMNHCGSISGDQRSSNLLSAIYDCF